MTAGNSYAVCDIGFELSFAAVVGTVAGGVCIRRARGCVVPPLLEESKEPGKTAVVFQTAGTSLGPCGKHLHLVLCFGGHIPVLVLRGLSVSIYAVVSSVAVLWLIQP